MYVQDLIPAYLRTYIHTHIHIYIHTHIHRLGGPSEVAEMTGRAGRLVRSGPNSKEIIYQQRGKAEDEVCVYVRVCVYVCVCVCVCMYIYIYIYTYIYTYACMRYIYTCLHAYQNRTKAEKQGVCMRVCG